MSNINLKLHGKFKFDLFTKQGDLIKSSEFVDNFITNSGVMYPYHFAFADCFRFLSVGTGSVANAISAPATTGLQYPLTGYSHIGGRAFWDSGVATSYYTQPGNFGAGCGYTNNQNGVSLIRQWNLPDNTGGVFSSSGIFTEFMVSPGRPYVTGFGGVKLCSCNDIDSIGNVTGLDCSSTTEYYEWLTGKYLTINHESRLIPCDATNAFARVIYPFTYSGDSILTVTYKLDIIVDTGIYGTDLTFKRADNAPNWNYQLRTVSSITQPGVMLINDGTVFNSVAPNGKTRLQHFDYDPTVSRIYSFENEYGESFVPPMGAPLEPSNLFLANQPYNQNIIVYLSTDNLQFLVNPNGGALTNSGNYMPWNATGTAFSLFTSGVMPFRNDNDVTLFSGGGYWSAKINSFNTRSNSGTAPSDSDVTIPVSTSGVTFEASTANTPSFSINYIGGNVVNGTRSAQVNYEYSFQGYNVSNQIPIKSFVAAYSDVAYGNAFSLGDNVNSVPFFDAVLSGVSGNADNAFLPVLVSSGPSGLGIQEFQNFDYNYLDGTINGAPYPIFNTILSWNVPCPAGVIGC